MSSNLTSSKSHLATYAQLANLKQPPALGPQHKPVPHVALVDAIRRESESRKWQVTRETFALSKDGAKLFGVIDLVPTVPLVSAAGDRGMSLGFRNSTNRSLAIKAVAGERVFVCDNLCMSGEVFALDHKNTLNFILADGVSAGFDKFLVQLASLEASIAMLQETAITDEEAKLITYDAFAERIVPVRLFDDVERHYFRPPPEATDCQPRTLFGLHNAFTRALQSLSPARMFEASVAVSRHFGIKS